eukprot:3221856-Amphidinium_carterae.1
MENPKNGKRPFLKKNPLLHVLLFLPYMKSFSARSSRAGRSAHVGLRLFPAHPTGPQRRRCPQNTLAT